jgi:hypothetical protein
VMEIASMASNTKTNYSSSKKGIINNIWYFIYKCLEISLQ